MTKVLRMHDVVQRTGLSKASIYRLMASNQFPKSVSLGVRSTGWVEDHIQDWLLKRIETSQQKAS